MSGHLATERAEEAEQEDGSLSSDLPGWARIESVADLRYADLNLASWGGADVLLAGHLRCLRTGC